ncbi:hypothetical protein [Vacuolonema iberomarrocanum]|uniref:hypothetical protein n=1 Tax=Vacuolonema iberomarrocanum TaxID=3454632 RepID=UPI001A049F3D|nr:hypothetical protein [filamentous cyanobacterium LEGE 07170]
MAVHSDRGDNTHACQAIEIDGRTKKTIDNPNLCIDIAVDILPARMLETQMCERDSNDRKSDDLNREGVSIRIAVANAYD